MSLVDLEQILFRNLKLWLYRYRETLNGFFLILSKG